MRTGENLRDLFFQSPYLKRERTTPFSNEKQINNKENISPLSGGFHVLLNKSSVKHSGGNHLSGTAFNLQDTPNNHMMMQQSTNTT
jgi:hypothetical protein